jgi:acyl carrier protein
MASQSNPALVRFEQQLVTLIAERILEVPAGLEVDTDLYEQGLDSMGIMQLLVLIEEEFSVSIPDSELTRDNFSTVRHLAQLLRERSQRAA